MRVNQGTLQATGLAAGLMGLLVVGGRAQSTVVVAKTYDATPDGSGQYASFSLAALNHAGQAAFEANLFVAPGAGNLGLYRGGGGPVTQIVRRSEAVPDGNGTFNIFESPAINDGGHVMFGALLLGTSGGLADDRGFFRGDGGSVIRVIREGDSAPDGNGTFSRVFGSPAVNNAGEAAFKAALTGTSGGGLDDRGIFRGDGTTLVRIAREDDPAPDANGKFGSFNDPAMDENGQVVFQAGLVSTSGGTDDNEGLFRGNGTVLVQVARRGQAAPDANGTLAVLGNPATNDTGLVAFRSSLINTAGGTHTNGVFHGDGTTITQIARSDDVPPDGNGSYSAFGDPVIGNSGQLAFQAFLSGTSGGTSDDSGIYRGAGATLTKIVREGESAPDNNGTFESFEDPVINKAGQVAFQATLTGTIGGSTDNEGLFLFDDKLGLFQMARKGDSLSGGTISSLSFSTGSLGFSFASDEYNGFNDAGQLAYTFVLTNTVAGVAIVTPPASTINSITITGTSVGPGGFTITWTTEPPGAAVDLHTSTDLLTWSGPISSLNTTGTFTDSPLPGPASFYAVVPVGTPFP